MSNFNINDLLGAKPEKKKPIYNIVSISVNDLVPNEDNFYSMNDIAELKRAILLAGGVKQNLTVTAIGGGKYKIISGHRRHRASKELYDEGKTEFEYLPCMIESVGADSNEKKLREELLLILTNSQRAKTDWDKVEEVRRLKEVLEQYKKTSNVSMRVRDVIADALKISGGQVGRMESISKNLSPEFKEELKNQNVNISTAYEVSGLTEEKQAEVLEKYKEKGNISIKEVKQIKRENAENTPQNMIEKIDETISFVEMSNGFNQKGTKGIILSALEYYKKRWNG